MVRNINFIFFSNYGLTCRHRQFLLRLRFIKHILLESGKGDLPNACVIQVIRTYRNTLERQKIRTYLWNRYHKPKQNIYFWTLKWCYIWTMYVIFTRFTIIWGIFTSILNNNLENKKKISSQLKYGSRDNQLTVGQIEYT